MQLGHGRSKWIISSGFLTVVLITAIRLPARTIHQSQNGTQAAAAPATKPTPTYEGADTCKTCHADVYNNEFQNTPHYKTLLNKNTSEQGCEGCHGPGSLHVNSGGQTPVPYVFTEMTQQAISQRCMVCHENRHENMEFLTSVHYRNGIGCTDCHSPHHSTDMQTLLVKDQPQLCFSCHREVEPQFRMPVHHKVMEGMVRCTDCHNPHGSFADAALQSGGENKQLRSGPAGDAVCTTCHVDKQGPFIFEHEPVRTDGCLACHIPHGSPNPHLLKYANVNQLCLQCHTVSSFSGAPGTPSFHNQAQKYQACTVCHTQIHGSNVNSFFFQ